MAKTVLLLSGTCEGRVLAKALSDAGFRVRATVTRPETVDNFWEPAARARDNAPERPLLAQRAHEGREYPRDVHIEARGFTEATLTALLQTGEIDAVLDATHPFAVRITKISHAVCGRVGTPYIRYERPDWEPPAGTIFVDSFAQAAAVLPELGSRIMLTIGCKQLKHFVHLQDRLSMHARILPAEVSLTQAVDAGFRRENLICLRPPVSEEANRASFQKLGIDVLVTKASGREGGVVEKVCAVRELGIRVVMIRRPVLSDIAFEDSVQGAVRACREKLA